MALNFITGTHRFHEDPNFNYQFNRWMVFGNLPKDVLLKAAHQIKNTDDWCRVFLALAETAEAQKDVLRAAFYYRAVDFFLPYDHSRKMEIYDRTVELMRVHHGGDFIDKRMNDQENRHVW
jgi:hypothetical protein